MRWITMPHAWSWSSRIERDDCHLSSCRFVSPFFFPGIRMREARRAIRLEWQMTFGIERMRSTAFEGRDFKRTRRRFFATTFDRLGNGEIKSRLGGFQKLRVLLSVAAASSSFFFFAREIARLHHSFGITGPATGGPCHVRTLLPLSLMSI